MGKGNGKGQFTVLGEGTVFEGTLTVPHDIRVDGKIKGKLETSEELTVGPSGLVEADVSAKSALVGGRIVGNVSVEDRVELQAKASLVGDIRARDLVINEGAVFHGNCAMDDGKAQKV